MFLFTISIDHSLVEKQRELTYYNHNHQNRIMNKGKVYPFTTVNTHQVQLIGSSKNILFTSSENKLNGETNKDTGKGVSIEVSTHVTHAGDNSFENIENQDAEK